ncbi:hypothetical protein BJX61DRAFT_490448 [Aspergillus egyptiacus]|nr:hypothetical protein BJX61DRAFT_490448 [Aspergillus egyptiacus]
MRKEKKKKRYFACASSSHKLNEKSKRINRVRLAPKSKRNHEVHEVKKVCCVHLVVWSFRVPGHSQNVTGAVVFVTYLWITLEVNVGVCGVCEAI